MDKYNTIDTCIYKGYKCIEACVSYDVYDVYDKNCYVVALTSSYIFRWPRKGPFRFHRQATSNN